MQAIYYPISQTRVDISVDKDLAIISNHDEYCLWFDVRKNQSEGIGKILMPSPKTGIQACVSRMRLGQINDSRRNEKYMNSLRKMIERYKTRHHKLPENILCISELTLLPFIAAVALSEFDNQIEQASPKLHIYEGNKQMMDFLKLYENTNKTLFMNVNIVYHSSSIAELKPNDICRQIDMVIGEPNFAASLLPWHNLLFW